MQASTGVPAARKQGGRRHTKGTCWGRVASEPSAWAADPPSWSEALEIDEARAPWPRQAGRSRRLGVAEVAALVRELAAFMFLADGVRNELLGRDARLSGGARL
jgi:hypothetical protein